jgi:hypothetical protein
MLINILAMCIINNHVFIYHNPYVPVGRDGEIVEGFTATPIKMICI